MTTGRFAAAKIIVLMALGIAASAACGGSSSPVAPAAPSTPATPATPAAPTLAACATWAGTQRATGVPAAVGSVSGQREAFYTAGGGVRKINSRYYAAWFPSNWASSSPRRVFVDLHGTGGAPETEWSVDWKDIMSAKGYAWIGLKYLDDGTGSYDDEATIYTNLKALVDDLKASCDFGSPAMMLQGYSRGSAETFPVAYLDAKDRRLFKIFADNSGAWMLGGALTPTMQGVVDRNELGAYSGEKFWMYCGGLDMEHGYPMCDEMTNAKAVIEKYGGTVAALFQDPAGGHGGLAKNATAYSALFAYFESQ